MYISLYSSGHCTCFILAYFPYFENIGVGLCDNLDVYIHMCVDLFIGFRVFSTNSFMLASKTLCIELYMRCLIGNQSQTVILVSSFGFFM
jgi:hypothetical protein